MTKQLIIALTIFTPFFALAGEISDLDIATYSLTGKNGQPSGILIRLSKSNGKWLMEGKENPPTAPWKNISCDMGCQYRASSNAEQAAYLASLPGEMSRQFDIACIQNIAHAFCKITKKQNASKGGYVLVTLVTEKPVPISLQRLTKPYNSKTNTELRQ